MRIKNANIELFKFNGKLYLSYIGADMVDQEDDLLSELGRGVPMSLSSDSFRYEGIPLAVSNTSIYLHDVSKSESLKRLLK